MQYQIRIIEDNTFAYLGNKQVAKFDTDTFLEKVISPKEFKSFEANPNKTNFNIRKLEFNLFRL